MTLTKSILAGTAALLLATAAASAADLYKGGSIKDGYMPAEPARAASWYVRGDYSHAWQSVGAITEPPAYELNTVSIANTSAWGVGIGRYFTQNIRGDITIDWRKNAHVVGTVNDTLATVQGERQFGVKNMVVLANMYYDFDTRTRFTPYLGVGLGFSRNQTSSGIVNVTPPATSSCGGATPTTTCEAWFDGATQTQVAGALMAGFSAKLRDRVTLDAGYRFLYLGDSHTGTMQTRSTVIATGVQTTGTAPDPIVKDQNAHEVRVGLRVDLR